MPTLFTFTILSIFTLPSLDIDECGNSSTIDCTQQCINTAGSYECDCYDGYRAITANATQCKGKTLAI